jgi:ABC-2 type transport system permease protein
MVAFKTLFYREILRFCRVIVQTLVAPFVSSFLYLLVFGINLGSQMDSQGAQNYMVYLIPGLMMMGFINNAYQNSSSSIINMKFTGELEDLRVVPLSNHQIVFAMGLAALLRGLIVALVTWLTGLVFLFWNNQPLVLVEHPLALLFFLTTSGLSFGFIGILVAFISRSFDQLSAFSTFVLLPLIYLGGVFMSVENLSPFWRFLAQLNPLLYFIEGVRYSFLGLNEAYLFKAVFISLVSVVVFYIAALKCLRAGAFTRW